MSNLLGIYLIFHLWCKRVLVRRFESGYAKVTFFPFDWGIVRRLSIVYINNMNDNAVTTAVAEL